jgi:ABC-type lipoprotein release transport system permease subunit
MKSAAIFCVFFIASFAIGATPILIGVALVYGVAWILARQPQAVHEPQPEPPKPKPATPPPFGETIRKVNL